LETKHIGPEAQESLLNYATVAEAKIWLCSLILRNNLKDSMRIQIIRITPKKRKIRFVYDDSKLLKLLHKNIYQFTVDMMFSNNCIERIYVSKLYECSYLDFLIELNKEIDQCGKYDNKYLVRSAVRRLGEPLLFT